MRDGVYLARYQGSPIINLTTKTSAILFITDISILEISSIISNPTLDFEKIIATGWLEENHSWTEGRLANLKNCKNIRRNQNLKY